MKLINYKYGYYDEFSCSINGKITMTQGEWQECIAWLKRTYKWVQNPRSYAKFYKELLEEDTMRFISTKKSYLHNIRVDATKAIAERHGLKNYKHNNYIIEVTK